MRTLSLSKRSPNPARTAFTRERTYARAGAALCSGCCAAFAFSACGGTYPVPPPQPSLTHGVQSDPAGTGTLSSGGSLGYPEVARANLGGSYTPHRVVALGLEGNYSGPGPSVYGRPSLAVFPTSFLALFASGSFGGLPSVGGHGVGFGGVEGGLRLGGAVGERRVQLWVGAFGGGTFPLGESRWTETQVFPPSCGSSYGCLGSYTTHYSWTFVAQRHASLELGLLVPAGRRVDVGVLLYGIAFFPEMPVSSAFWNGDVAALVSVRVRSALRPPRPRPEPSAPEYPAAYPRPE